MPENGFTPDESTSSGSSLRGWHLIVIAAAAILVAVAVYQLFLRGGPPKETPPPTGITEVPEGSRTVTLYFASANDVKLVRETRQLAMGKQMDEQVRQVLEALVAGPTGEGISTIPKGTKILDVFYAPDTFTLYIDFSSELVAGHPGGSTAEYYTIASVLRTVSENFPEIQAVQFLVDGEQVGTIAGHIDAYDPFMVRDWR